MEPEISLKPGPISSNVFSENRGNCKLKKFFACVKSTKSAVQFTKLCASFVKFVGNPILFN